MTELNEAYQQRCRFFEKFEDYVFNKVSLETSLFDKETMNRLCDFVSKVEQLYEAEHGVNYKGKTS